jgi:hypothetical protein
MHYMTREEKMNELGLMGEKVVTNMLNRLNPGLVIEHSVNKFDSEKDMLVDGKKVEVKTESPYVFKDCFSFRPNQLRKCRNVDVLYIVSVPHVKFKHHSDGWVYRLVPSDYRTFTYRTKFNVEMIGIPIRQEAVIPVYKMTDEEITELMKYSNTEYT